MSNKKKKKCKEPEVLTYEGHLPIYNIPFYIYIGVNMLDIRDVVIKNLPGLDMSDFTEEFVGYAMRVTHHTEGTNFSILVNVKSVKELPGVIAHECLHLSWFICETVGIELEPMNHEAQAYIHEYLFNDIYSSVKDYIKRNKLKIKL